MRRFTPLLVILVLLLAGFLLYRTLSGYSLDQIVTSVAAIPPVRLALAGVLAAASYLCLTGFDALAVRYAGRPLPYRRVALASFVSLSIGHNIGFAALSSGAIRYRFYSRWGMGPGEVAKVILFCGATVGLGLMILAGAALLLRPALAQEITGLQQPIVLGIGATCLGLVAAYIVLAATVRRPLQLGKWSLQMPTVPLALGQIIIGPLNFAFVAACLHQTLAAVADVAYLGVVSVYVIANAAALITHVPGGLGVIESVVLLLLPQAEIIGALVVFRFIYFLVPLSLGCPILALTELTRRGRKPARDRGAYPERN
ncbi:lysylphosphatidylglycerol synthase domain-containing protein [Rhodospirillaceae bacterium SYSU D60014]|uniref:lysylphosphatidylglycerol synthase domain-containing protein n=1 Tax=Virgifigura deserti TaxID=2268457 RepID=UPI000E66EB8F